MITDKDAQRRIWCMFGDIYEGGIRWNEHARLVHVGKSLSWWGPENGAITLYMTEDGTRYTQCRECTPEELAEHGLTQPPRPWADRVRQWAIDRNLIKGSKPKDQLAKGAEELGELASGIIRGDMAKIEDSIVDVVVVMRIIAEQYGIDWYQCLEKGWDQIKDRKGWTIDGVFVKEVTE